MTRRHRSGRWSLRGTTTMNRQDDDSNHNNDNDNDNDSGIHQQETSSSSFVSASWRLRNRPEKDHETEPPLWQYCRTGQWHSILEYFQNVGHCDDQYRYASSYVGTAVTNQHHRHRHQQRRFHIDDRCLQYVIRSTTAHPKSGISRQLTGTESRHHDGSESSSSSSSSSTAAIQIDSAPQRRVMELLLQHHPGLIAVIHPLTGTIAHEAIQYHNPNHVIHFLLQQMIHHDNNIPQIPPLLFQVQDDIGRSILHCLIGRWQRSHCFYRQGMSTVRGSNDDIDSCCHHDTETVTHLQLFRLIVRAHPPQISIPDFDGYTPLLQLLQTTNTTTLHHTVTEWGIQDRRHSNTETTDVHGCDNEMYEMIQCMIQYQPNVVTILKRVPCYYHTYQPPPQHHQLNNHGRDRISTSSRRSRSSTSGSSTCHIDRNAIHAPLFYALLYCQSQPTIQLLLDTYRQINDSPYSSLILSQYQEVALHIAVTTSASISILRCIVQDCHQSTILYTDMHQLTPVDWLWLVYVREYSNAVLLPHHPPQQHPDQNVGVNNNNNNNAADPALHHLSVTTQRLRQVISRRRHLSNHIVQWHESISTEQQQRVDLLFHNRTNHVSVALPPPIDHPDDNHPVGSATTERTSSMQNLEDDFLLRLQTFLPFAASALWQEEQTCTMGAATSCRMPTTPFDNVENNTTNNFCLLLHAACYVPCPVTVVQLILLHLYRHPNQPPQQKHRNPLDDEYYCPLQHRDTVARRYPLHYAADRVSYRRCLPIGFNLTIPSASISAPNRSHLLLEDLTPVQVIGPLYPDACSRRDLFGQLPLHIVIDTYKRYRRTYYTRCRMQQEMNLSGNEHVSSDGAEINCYNKEQDDVIELLVQLYPASLQMRDGRTMLYPYQQAAAGVDAVVTSDDDDTVRNTTNGNGDWNEADIHGCRLTTIYQLLRRDPTLID